MSDLADTAKCEVILTGDGSHSLFRPDLDEPYHSHHGAIAESEHVFVQAGLHGREHHQPLRILEVGMGTGLNVLLTCRHAMAHGLTIEYTAVEAYPIPENLVEQLNYADQLRDATLAPIFQHLHAAPWREPIALANQFTLTKLPIKILELTSSTAFHVIYFDAFGPEKQPEMWEAPVMHALFGMLEAGGCLVTYSAKGAVKRTLKAAGFEVERLPGPPGKREMTRAVKLPRS